jgi:hypothetical protein
LEDAGVPFDPGLPSESQTLVWDVPAEELSAEEQYDLRRYVGECLPAGTPSSIILEEILMADGVGGCLPAGTHSSIIREETFAVDGDDGNSVTSLDDSYSSPYFVRAETFDRGGIDSSVDASPRAWDNYLPGVPVEPRLKRPRRCVGGRRHFRHRSANRRRDSVTAPVDPELAARGNASRRRIHAAAGRSLDFVRSKRRFLFGNKVPDSLDTCTGEVPTPGEVLEFSLDAVDMYVPFLFDIRFRLRSQLSAMLGKDILLLKMTDSKSLFDIMKTQKRTTDGRLMVDVLAARQSLERASNLGFHCTQSSDLQERSVNA